MRPDDPSDSNRLEDDWPEDDGAPRGPRHPEVPPADDPGSIEGPGIRNTRLMARAIRERWPMPDRTRIKILKALARRVDAENWANADGAAFQPPPSHREVIAAARALLQADRLNLDAERLKLQAKDPEASDLRAVHDRLDLDMAAYQDPDADGPRTAQAE